MERPYPDEGYIPADRYDLLPAHWRIVSKDECLSCRGTGMFFPDDDSDLRCSVCDGQGEMWQIEWAGNLEPHTQRKDHD